MTTQDPVHALKAFAQGMLDTIGSLQAETVNVLELEAKLADAKETATRHKDTARQLSITNAKLESQVNEMRSAMIRAVMALEHIDNANTFVTNPFLSKEVNHLLQTAIDEISVHCGRDF